MIVASGGVPNVRTTFLPSMLPLTLCQPGFSLYRAPQEYIASTPSLPSFSTTTVVAWKVCQHISRSPCQTPERLATAGGTPGPGGSMFSSSGNGVRAPFCSAPAPLPGRMSEGARQRARQRKSVFILEI